MRQLFTAITRDALLGQNRSSTSESEDQLKQRNLPTVRSPASFVTDQATRIQIKAARPALWFPAVRLRLRVWHIGAEAAATAIHAQTAHPV